jgi:hypothetical protein
MRKVCFECDYGIGEELYVLHDSRVVKAKVIHVICFSDGCHYCVELLGMDRTSQNNVLTVPLFQIGKDAESLIRNAVLRCDMPIQKLTALE